MKLSNRQFLRAILSVKRQLAVGVRAPERSFGVVRIAPFLNNVDAAVCISADFELNWAWRLWCSAEETSRRGCVGRQNVPKLLSMMRTYGIPITWATVGHLFLECCERGPCGKAHSHMPRPPGYSGSDWYDQDPCTSYQIDPLWYAPDLIQQILDDRVSHELGTHSFSHINFSAATSDTELVRAEIEASIEAMARFGIKPRSLVYPFNAMGHHHLETLGGLGITSVRHRDRHFRLAYPDETEFGIFRSYESMNLRSPRYYDYLTKVKIMLDVAKRTQTVFHIWFHPSDDWLIFQREFDRILGHFAAERDAGNIWVATMGDLTAYAFARAQTRIEVAQERNNLLISLQSSNRQHQYGDTEISLIIRTKVQPKRVCSTREGDARELAVEKIKYDPKRNEAMLTVSARSSEIKVTFNEPDALSQ